MLKRIVLSLLMVLSFMFSGAWADDRNESAIVQINGKVRAYIYVATKIANKTKLESKEISVANPLMEKVTKFYEIAQEQSKSYAESLVDKTIRVNGIDVLFTKGNRMIWVSDDEIKIKFDKEKNVIASLHVMR